MWTSGTLLKNRHHRTDLQGRNPLSTPCGSHSRLPGRGRGASAVCEIQPDDVMQEFRVDQHVEADRHLLGLAPDEGAADIVLDAEDFQEEIVRDRQGRADLQFCAVKRDGADQAAYMRPGAEVVADEDDPSRPFDLEFLESLDRKSKRLNSSH